METLKINRKVLEFVKIIYVENYGDDNNDGSKGSPVRTMARARDLIKNGYCMKFGDGEFEIDDITSFASTFDYSVIGNAEKTIVKFNECLTSYAINQNVKTTLIRLVLQPSDKFNSSPEQRVYFYINVGSKLNFDFYNVLFKLNKKSTIFPTQGDFYFSNSGYNENHNCNFVNCTLENTNLTSHMFGTNQKCMYNLATYYDKYNMSEITVNSSYVHGIEIDEQGNITNNVEWKNRGVSTFTKFDNHNPDGTQPHLGVYGGVYAWGNWNQYCVIKKDDEYFTITDGTLTSIPNYDVDKFEDNKTTVEEFNKIVNTIDDGYQLIFKDNEKVNIKGIKQTSGLVVGKDDILTTIQRNIDYFKSICHIDDNSFVKIVFTMDSGETWYTHNNGQFEEIDIEIPLKPHAEYTDIEKQNFTDATQSILEKGIAYSELENLDFNGFNLKKIRFAYALSVVDKDSTCLNRELQWRFDSKGNMIKMSNDEYKVDLYDHKVDFTTKISNDLIKVNILTNVDGDEKDNLLYVENSEIDTLFAEDTISE